MSNENINISNQSNFLYSSTAPFAYVLLTLEAFFHYYLEFHERSYRSGPSYDVFAGDVRKYVMPVIGKIQLKDLAPEMLRGCYNRAYKWYFIPLSMITGMNHLLEVAFDSIVRPGMYHSNPAAALSAEHVIKTQRKLPYMHYPIAVRQMSPGELDSCSEDDIYYDISVPYFSDICYLGTDPVDGINLVRRFLIDELVVNPWPSADLTLRDYPLNPNTQIVMVELNT